MKARRFFPCAYGSPLVAFVCFLTLGSTYAQLPPVPVPPENPITEPKRVLGKILFWDEQLSTDNTVSCGTCHIPASGGADPILGLNPGADLTFGTPDDVFGSFGVVRQNSNGVPIVDPVFGFDVQVTGRSAPPAIGAQWAPRLFWDGRANAQFIDPDTLAVSIVAGGALESQAVGPPVSDVEMAHENRDWTDIITKLTTATPLMLAANIPPDAAAVLAGGPSYPDLFLSAFGDAAITSERIAFAIATYERTLIADQTPWDAFIAGNPAAMTPNQTAGWNFFNTTQCVICHAPPLFTDNTFRNIGVRPIAEDNGRQAITGNPADAGRFKTPSLRNVGLKSSHMHNGRFTSIGQVVDFYIPAGGQVQFPANQDPLIPPINIPPQVRPQLIDFMQNALTDPRVANEQFPFDRPKLYSEMLDDQAMLSDCLSGPGVSPIPTPPTTTLQCLQQFDVDMDNDVDIVDAAAFQDVY